MIEPAGPYAVTLPSRGLTRSPRALAETPQLRQSSARNGAEHTFSGAGDAWRRSDEQRQVNQLIGGKIRGHPSWHPAGLRRDQSVTEAPPRSGKARRSSRHRKRLAGSQTPCHRRLWVSRISPSQGHYRRDCQLNRKRYPPGRLVSTPSITADIEESRSGYRRSGEPRVWARSIRPRAR